MDKVVIAIVGPTAIGKTSLAIKLANRFDTEIISADSRQFYKEMSIGTAVPSEDELRAAPHHFIHHLSIEESYSVGQYEQEAMSTIENLFKKQNILILVGGSGLYIDAVTAGLDRFPDIDAKVRQEVRELLDKRGFDFIQQELQRLDPFYYDQVDIHNTQRLLRALEVCISSGKPYSSFLGKDKTKRPFRVIKIGLTAERPVIYERINQRVDLMIQNGLEEEARLLFPYRQNNALNTVGYKELFHYFEGNYNKETAIAEIKKNTRRFAKRQLTWYRKDPEIRWFDYQTDFGTISTWVERIIKP